MPRAHKTDKFFFNKPSWLRRCTGKHWLIGANHSFEGSKEKLTLQDLLDALAAHGIQPEKVYLAANFIAMAEK